MKHAIDDPSKIDSKCYAPPVESNGPTDETCGRDATTYVRLTTGVRRYVCPTHAEEVDRFDDTDADHPTVVVCEACQSLTPKSHVDFDGRCDDCSVV
jgi:hypothetical protein